MAQEKNFENKIKKFLAEQGAWVLKTWGGGMQRSGVPDLICCVNGVFVGIEVKASRGKPSDLQQYNIAWINKSGGVGVILYPEGFETFKKIVKGVMMCNIVIQELTALKDANSSTSCDILTNYDAFQTPNQQTL